MKSDIISIAMGELTTTFDNEVVKAVRKVGIDVDKEELLKALELHRSLVRCRECKWFDSGKNDSEIWSMCTRHFGKYIDVNADDFCSYGEREGE